MVDKREVKGVSMREVQVLSFNVKFSKRIHEMERRLMSESCNEGAGLGEMRRVTVNTLTPQGWLLTHQWYALERKLMPEATIWLSISHTNPLPFLPSSTCSAYTIFNNPRWTVTVLWPCLKFLEGTMMIHVNMQFDSLPPSDFSGSNTQLNFINQMWHPLVLSGSDVTC